MGDMIIIIIVILVVIILNDQKRREKVSKRIRLRTNYSQSVYSKGGRARRGRDEIEGRRERESKSEREGLLVSLNLLNSHSRKSNNAGSNRLQ